MQTNLLSFPLFVGFVWYPVKPLRQRESGILEHMLCVCLKRRELNNANHMQHLKGKVLFM